MRAAELPGIGMPIRMVTRAVPEPGLGEVRIRVDACGVCGSDLLLQDGGFGEGVTFPVIPGHEAAGTVDEIGPGVVGFSIGDQVAVYYVDCPPDSKFKAVGRENLHPGMTRMGVDIDGAFAEYVVRPATTLIKTPAFVDPAALAVLTDAVATPYHAVVTRANVQAGETVVVIGIGGLGSNAVQLAARRGARVIAVSRSRQKLELAQQLGAAEAVLSDDATATRINTLTDGEGPDVVIQCVGSPHQDALAIQMAGAGGRVVLVGASSKPFQARALDILWKELTIHGSCRFTSAEIRAVIDMYIQDEITVDHLISGTRPLEEANQALNDLRNGAVLRSILLPGV